MDAVAVRAVLARTPSLRADHVRALLTAAGGDITRILEPATVASAGLTPAARRFLTCPDSAALRSDLTWIAASGARLCLSTDADYPPQLLESAGAPAVLFVLGDVSALASRQLAIVGARSATVTGRKTARDFASRFAGAGVTVTSGLALGIDAAGHEGALLAGGRTVAVCGTGLDRLYPAQHIALAAQIRQRGALVSQFPPGTPPLRCNFPRRNRVISALSLGTVVVEAARGSGSIITARHALKQGRAVFAVPGSIHNALARGCHDLIRGGATLAESAAEVLTQLGISPSNEQLTRQPAGLRQIRTLDKEYEMLLDAVGFEPATLDCLVARTGLPGGSVASMLLVLELEGRVAPYPGGRFGRIP